jgi:hypothetical protein
MGRERSRPGEKDRGSCSIYAALLPRSCSAVEQKEEREREEAEERRQSS